MHDFDNNTKLDGLEIYKALTHLLPFEPENEEKYKTTAQHNQGKTKDEIDSMRKADELQYYTGTDSFNWEFLKTISCISHFTC